MTPVSSSTSAPQSPVSDVHDIRVLTSTDTTPVVLPIRSTEPHRG